MNRNKLPHFNQVIRWRIPNLTQKGGSKYRVHQGYGCIWRRYHFYIFLFFAYLVELYLQMSKVMKTQHIMSLISSCLIRIRWKSPNLIQKGGSKYRVHQGYGCVWRRYRFFLNFVFLYNYISTVKSFENTTHHVSFFILSLISS